MNEINYKQLNLQNIKYGREMRKKNIWSPCPPSPPKKLLVLVLETTTWHMETEPKDDAEYTRVDVKKEKKKCWCM